MRKIKNCILVCILMFLFLCNVCSTYAQNGDEFCGTWYSAVFQEGGRSVRHVLNIVRQNDNFVIQLSRESSAGETLCRLAQCRDISQNGNKMSWHYQDSPNFGVNGKGIVTYFGLITEYGTAELTDDTIKYKRYRFIIDYRRNSYDYVDYSGEKYEYLSDIIFHRNK